MPPIANGMAKARRTRSRSQEAVAEVGPLGYLFASASAARILSVFAAEPEASFTLSDLKQRSHAAKGTMQADLRRLTAARLIRREGQGNKTSYRYALDQELGRKMLQVMRLSRSYGQMGSPVAIPWLAGLASQRPAAGSWNPFGGREEAYPSDETTRRVLEAGEPVPEAEEPRALPHGLRTRR